MDIVSVFLMSSFFKRFPSSCAHCEQKSSMCVSFAKTLRGRRNKAGAILLSAKSEATLSVLCPLDARVEPVESVSIWSEFGVSESRVFDSLDMSCCDFCAGYDLGICPSWKVLSNSVNLRSRSFGSRNGVGTAVHSSEFESCIWRNTLCS